MKEIQMQQQQHLTEENFLYHSSCDNCKSSDANAVYEKHSYCFSCNTHTKGEAEATPIIPLKTTTSKSIDFISGETTALPKRKIDLATTSKFNYQVGSYFGRPCHIANYYDDNKKLVAQKLRYPNKDFQWIGEAKQSGLFGQQLWSGKGKMIVITEGEIDALVMSQLNQNKFPTVSVKSGATAAKKDVQRSLEFLEGYDKCIFMFDNDTQGQEGALECAKLLTPGKARIATLPLNDPSDMLIAGRTLELTKAIWEATSYKPDGIVFGTEIFDEIMEVDNHVTAQYPFASLNVKTHGLRKGELVTITAGSGVGKSSFCRHLALDLLKQKFAVGYIALEESIKRSALGIMGVHLKSPLHLTRDGISLDEMQKTFKETIGNGKFYLYNHFGSSAADNLLNKIRYLAKSCDVDFVILDHLHMALSALGDEHTNDERKLIDYFVSKLRTLVEETGIGVVLVSHLRRSEGDKGYEDGKEVTMNALRGSASIGQLSDVLISMSRDIKSDAKLAKVNILKNRFSGETGRACTLQFNLDTGCLEEVKSEVLDDF
jgi:twinkle protein